MLSWQGSCSCASYALLFLLLTHAVFINTKSTNNPYARFRTMSELQIRAELELKPNPASPGDFVGKKNCPWTGPRKYAPEGY